MIGGSAKGKLSSGRAEDYNNNTIIANSNRMTMNTQNTMRLAQATPTNGMRMPHLLNDRSVMRPINGLSGRMNQPRQSVHFALPPLPPGHVMPMPPMPPRQNEKEGRRNCKNPGAQGGFGLVAADDSRRRPTSEGRMKEVLARVRRTAFGLEEDYEEQPLIAPEVPDSTELEMPTDRIYVFRRSWTRDEAGNVLSEEVFKAYEYHLGDPRNTIHIVT